ncbi:hypothetical protein AAG906_008967 [Vitis piasezkii]
MVNVSSIDSPSWKLVDHRWPDFASKPRNLRLAISADVYDVIFINIGPRQPGNDIDVYLAPLLDDLKILWDVGLNVMMCISKRSLH